MTNTLNERYAILKLISELIIVEGETKPSYFQLFVRNFKEEKERDAYTFAFTSATFSKL